jgi:hypothetical protein
MRRNSIPAARAASPSTSGRSLGIHIAAFELIARELLAESTFHIEYKVHYAGEGSFSNETKEVSGYLWLISLGHHPLLVDHPDYPDPKQRNFEMTGAVEVNQNVIKVNLRPLEEPQTSHGRRMRVLNVTLKVRLDVHGDAYERHRGGAWLNKGERASLVVPTTAEGKRWVRLDAMKRDDEAKSFETDWLFPKS